MTRALLIPVLVAAVACSKAQTHRQLDVANAVDVQALNRDGTRAIVNYSSGFPATSPPHSAIVDLVSGASVPVASQHVTVIDVAGTKASVISDAIGLAQLDVGSGALLPVTPAEAFVPAGATGFRPSICDGSQYFYPTVDGRLGWLPAAADHGSALPAGDRCNVTGARDLRALGNGWFELGVDTSDCGSANRMVNPAASLVSPAYVRRINGPAGSFLFTGTTSIFTSDLLLLDLTSGAAMKLRTNVGFQGAFTSPDKSRLYFQWSDTGTTSNFSVVDLSTGAVTDLGIGVSLSFASNGVLITTWSASQSQATWVRFDTGKVIPLCAGWAFLTPNAAGCQASGTLVVYEWNIDATRTLSTNALRNAVVSGGTAVWEEPSGTRAAFLGDGAAPVTLCPGSIAASLAPALSADGHTVIYQCAAAGSPVMIADLRSGPAQAILTPPAGSSISPARFAVSPGGRLASVDYTTNAPAGDPISCGNASCSFGFDVTTGKGASGISASPFGTPSSPAEDLLLQESGQVILLSSGAPRAVQPPVALNVAIARSPDLRFLFGTRATDRTPVLLDLVAGTSVDLPIWGYTGAPLQIGDSHIFVVRDGFLYLDTGVMQAIPSWTPLCSTNGLVTVGGSFSYLDGVGSLHRVTAAGDAVIGANVHPITNQVCTDPIFVDTDYNGDRGTLSLYDQAAGTLHPIQAGSAPSLVPLDANRLLGFFYPGTSTLNELFLIDRPTLHATPLGVRGALTTNIKLSPSGARVVLDAAQGVGAAQLVVAQTDGSGAHLLGPTTSQFWFSPDETRVLLVYGAQELWVENPLGSSVRVDNRIVGFYADASAKHILYWRDVNAGGSGTFLASIP